MFTKQKKFIAPFLGKARKKEGNVKKPSFFELAIRHAVPGGKENRNLSQEIDAILYGAPINNN